MLGANKETEVKHFKSKLYMCGCVLSVSSLLSCLPFVVFPPCLCCVGSSQIRSFLSLALLLFLTLSSIIHLSSALFSPFVMCARLPLSVRLSVSEKLSHILLRNSISHVHGCSISFLNPPFYYLALFLPPAHTDTLRRMISLSLPLAPL